MDCLDNLFSQPSRRDLLRLSVAGGAACTLGTAGAAWAQQDAAGTADLAGPKL